MKLSEFIYRLSYELYANGDRDVSFSVIDKDLVERLHTNEVVMVCQGLDEVNVVVKENLENT